MASSVCVSFATHTALEIQDNNTLSCMLVYPAGVPSKRAKHMSGEKEWLERALGETQNWLFARFLRKGRVFGIRASGVAVSL